MLGQRTWAPYPHEVPGSGVGSGSSAFSEIVWRPGVPSNGPVVETSAEVKAASDASPVPLLVYVDSSLAAALMNVSIDCKGSTAFNGFHARDVYTDMFTIADGSALTNPGGFAYVFINMVCATSPAMIFADQSMLNLTYSLLTVLAGAGSPAINVPSGQTLNMLTNQAEFLGAGVTSVLVNLVGNARLKLTSNNSFGVEGPGSLVSGGAASEFDFIHDSQSDPLANQIPLFAGTYGDNRTDNLADAMPSAGPTVSRPTAFPFLRQGQDFFDSNQGQKLTWDGNAWRNGFGRNCNVAPTIVAANAGDSASLSAGSTDWAGEIFFNTGVTPAAGAQFTFSFSAATPPGSPRSVILTPGNTEAALLISPGAPVTPGIFAFVTGNGFTVATARAGAPGTPGASNSYTFFYQVVGQ